MRGDGVAGSELTPWEIRVLGLVADGWTNRALAARFGRQPTSFEKVRSSIYRKLRVRNAPQAVKRGIEQGVVPLSVQRSTANRRKGSASPWDDSIGE